MKILIFGAGGVGSVVGGFLARLGHDVTLLGRAWHLDEIEKKGLKITGIWGEYHLKAFELYRSAAEIQKSAPAFDLIILTVKSYDTEQAVQELSPLIGEDTMLLSLQNGLGNIETILKKIPAEQFLAGRVIFGVEIQPGVVTVTVNADDIVLGALPGVTPKVSALRIAQTLSLSRLPVRAVPDILTHLWLKVIYNSALNGICTIREIPYGKILESKDTAEEMDRVIRECYEVAQGKGIALEPSSPEAFIERMRKVLIPKTAAHLPSMLQDIRKKKRTDIEALNGAICRLGQELGIATPANRQITDRIREIERSTPSSAH